jgi:tRNA A64-2'-O-ribosylphosphate transferase
MANKLLEFVMTMPETKKILLDLGKRMKPLRPLFVCQDSSLFFDHAEGQINLEDTIWELYIPVICLSASSCALPRYQALAFTTKDQFTVSIPYRYVQGAADDEESWSRGRSFLTIWENMERILLECITESERAELLESLAIATVSRPHLDNCFSLLPEFDIAIGDERCTSGLCFRQFDLVLCCAKEVTGKNAVNDEAGPVFIDLCIPKGNYSQRMLLESFPKVFDAYKKLTAEGKTRLLIYGKTGNDRAVCIAMFLMLSCYPSRFTTVSGVIDKTAIKKALIYVQQHRSSALPCRANLKALNVHFMRRSE